MGAGGEARQPLTSTNQEIWLGDARTAKAASIVSPARKATPCLPGHKGRGKQREPTSVNRQPQRAEATGSMANVSMVSPARKATPCLPGHKGRGKQREPTPVNRQPQRAEVTGQHGEDPHPIVRKEGYALLARPQRAREAARAYPCQPPTTRG
jgi:hypothetical protein